MSRSNRSRIWILVSAVVTGLLAYAAVTPEAQADAVIPLDELSAAFAIALGLALLRPLLASVTRRRQARPRDFGPP